MTPKYPFKHLAAYEREDKVFYFGRERETSELYQMTFETDLILLYGKSGVGKSSLISCGLANKFKSYEWLEISVRRGNNINDSLTERLNEKIDEKDQSSDIAEQIRMLRRQYFKPVYLIFDQFEELYISGDEEEQKQFYSTVKNILTLNQPVKIIISLREEYLGYLYDFEKAIPQLFSHKCWVQPMKLEVKDENFNIIDEILQGVIDNGKESLVSIQDGDKEQLAEGIKQMFRNAGEKTVDLPSLQILFDQLYLSLTDDDTFQTETVFSYKKLEDRLKGNIKNVLQNYLDKLVKELVKKKQIDPEIIWKVLFQLVTEQGTKKSLSQKDLQKQFPESDIAKITDFFREKEMKNQDNILTRREQSGETFWELRHDALAKRIREELDNKELKDKRLELKKKKRQLLVMRLTLGIAVISLLVSVVFAVFAFSAKNEAEAQRTIAEKELINRKIVEFEEIEGRVERIKNKNNPEGDPQFLLDSLLKIANTLPDSIKLEKIKIIEKYK